MPDDNTVEVVIEDGQKPADGTASSTNGSAQPQQRQRPQQQDQRTRPQSQDARSIPDDENDYGRKVQKRINDYRRKLGQAEAVGANFQREAARLAGENQRLTQMLSQQNAQAMNTYAEAVKARENSAQKALKAAHDSGDGQAIVEATRELSAAASMNEQVTRAQQQMEAQRQAQPQQVQQQPQQQEQQRERPRYSAETEAWIDRNPWFEEDDDARETAMRLHNKIVDQGFTPDTKEYFEELDKRMAGALPEVVAVGPDRRPRLQAQDDQHAQEQGEEAEEQPVEDPFNPPSMGPQNPKEMRPLVTAKGQSQDEGQVRPRYETTPVRRAAPQGQRQNGPVRLTPAQVEAARISGVTLEAYAKSLVHPSVATTTDGPRSQQRRT